MINMATRYQLVDDETNLNEVIVQMIKQDKTKTRYLELQSVTE